MSSSLLQTTSLKYYSQEQIGRLAAARVPEHIAIIMDGNRRWARKEAHKLVEGHRTGADILLDVLKAAQEIGVRVITLYSFSTENWQRDQTEVAALMWLFETYIRKYIPEMVQQRIRFETIGDISKLPEAVLQAIGDAKAATKDCEAMEVVFAVNYGARDEMKRAVQKIVESSLSSKDITEKTISSFLDTARYPDPDLLIRTGGEHRISNFLLWQLCYTELFITPTLWPDFTPELLLQAILEFQQRERRAGT